MKTTIDAAAERAGKLTIGRTPAPGRTLTAHMTDEDPRGFARKDAAAEDCPGYSILPAGEVIGDGLDDLIAVASGAEPNGNNSGASYMVFPGAGYIVFGRADGTVVKLSDESGGNGDFAANGVPADD